MLKILKPFIFLSFFVAVLTGCKLKAEKQAIHFEVVSDSLSMGERDYNKKLLEWKNIYEECLQNRLFQNAMYMGLQENVHIGSISNRNATNINKQFSIFDSSNRKNIINLFAPIKVSNCYAEITKDLQNNFYIELIKSLKSSGQYGYLTDYIDTSKIVFKITSIADNSLRPDSLASLLERTKDTSLLHFRQMLLTEGNALLVRTAMILGFYCEFPLKKKLSLEEEKKFKNEQFFKIGSTGDNGRIRLNLNQHLEVSINKYYTVLGQFYSFKENE